MKKLICFAFFLLISTVTAYSHCEIPCGIHDDALRFSILEEHITTIEKSTREITSLSKEEIKNYNQIVRWVDNKEKHAEEFQHIISQYFMTQRLKPSEKKEGEEYESYVRKLTLLHELIIYAMKAKQGTDLSNVEKLRSRLSEFKTLYLK